LRSQDGGLGNSRETGREIGGDGRVPIVGRCYAVRAVAGLLESLKDLVAVVDLLALVDGDPEDGGEGEETEDTTSNSSTKKDVGINGGVVDNSHAVKSHAGAIFEVSGFKAAARRLGARNA